MNEIIVALITGGVTLVGVLISNQKSQAVTDTKLEELTREVREHKYWVYKHTFPNGKVYIGITMQYPCKRWRNGKGYGYNEHFSRAVQKYGWDSVEHEIIGYMLTKDEACKMEQDLIAKYKSNDPRYGYNSSAGGEHGGYGVVPSKSSREKRSASMKGKNTGIAVGGKSAKAKAVRQYAKDGSFIAEYGSTTDAQRATGTQYSGIVKCCTGNQKTANGYIWLYAWDVESLENAVKKCQLEKSKPSEETKRKTSESMKRYWENRRERHAL